MDKQHNINRRDFLKIVGISTLGATASLYGCSPKKDSEKEGNTTVPVGKMTYRNFSIRRQGIIAGIRMYAPANPSCS